MATQRGPAAGFTLIEIIVTIVVVGVISGIAALIIAQGMRAYSEETVRSDVVYQARLALQRMAREARLVRSCGDIAAPANPSATLSFTNIDGAAVAFTTAGGVISRGADVLATGITSAQPFRFLDRAGNATTSCAAPNDIWFIEISVAAAQGAETIALRTRVHPRSF